MAKQQGNKTIKIVNQNINSNSNTNNVLKIVVSIALALGVAYYFTRGSSSEIPKKDSVQEEVLKATNGKG